MQNDIARKIMTLAARPEPLSESEVSHLMTLCRKYLDHTEEQPTAYPTLEFFCDWALHIAIDRNVEGFAILKRINDIVVELAAVPDNDQMMQRATEVVSFRKLRGELGRLFQGIGVANSLVEDQGRWVNFAKQLIEIIRDCPLKVGQVDRMPRRARELYEAIKSNPLKPRCWVIGVAVREVDAPDGKNLICLNILTMDLTEILIPMAAREVFGPAI